MEELVFSVEKKTQKLVSSENVACTQELNIFYENGNNQQNKIVGQRRQKQKHDISNLCRCFRNQNCLIIVLLFTLLQHVQTDKLQSIFN